MLVFMHCFVIMLNFFVSALILLILGCFAMENLLQSKADIYAFYIINTFRLIANRPLTVVERLDRL